MNSKTQVPNLNASLLGGKSATGFVQGAGSVTQSGLIGVGSNTEVFLGRVGNMGGLWGNCRNSSATGVSIVLKTDNALGPFLFVSPSQSGTGFGGGSFVVLGNTSQGIATAQITTSAGGAATMTVSAFNPISGNCQFSMQSVYSHA